MLRPLPVLLALVAAALLPLAARADGTWLDEQPPQQWNEPRMDVPAAPANPDADLVDPRCVESARPAETDEDREVVGAGWILVGGYEGGWGVKVVTATTSYDGMCRPLQFQQFVFVDGIFAGTTSPMPMDSRTDGTAGRPFITGPDRLFVQFSRYAPEDPLCCPSRTSSAAYTVDRSAGAPVLMLASVFTQPTG